jgi:hypothetical protein
MHRATLAGTKRRTRGTRGSACHWRTALKNRLAWNWTPRHWTRGAGNGNSGLDWRRWPQRGLVHWTWSGLWNDHARRWRRRSCRTGRNQRRCRRTRRNNWRHGRGRSLHWCGRHHLTRRHTDWRRRKRTRNRRRCRRRRDRGRSLLWRRNNGPRRRNGGCRRHGYWRNRRCGQRTADRRLRCCRLFYLRCNMRTRSRRRNRAQRHRWRGSFLLLRDCLQHIPGTRNVRQINLGFDFFFAATAA